jgi:2-iminobutanoate/2-iminopropanoate deaminase
MTTMRTRAIEPQAGLAYAQALEVTGAQRLLFISGQVPADADGNVPADYRSQYRLAWANVEAKLRAADMTFDNLVKVTIFLSDRRYVAESKGLRAEVLGDRHPALTIVITGIFDEAWLLEIEAIAAA